eukprot:4302072-Prorocentrum_lima.AAC.1
MARMVAGRAFDLRRVDPDGLPTMGPLDLLEEVQGMVAHRRGRPRCSRRVTALHQVLEPPKL